jgi:hypothetical protein
LNIQKYVLEKTDYDLKKLLINWEWLIDDEEEVYNIIIVTKMGNLLVRTQAKQLFFLNTKEGSFEQISNYYTDFAKNKLQPSQYLEIFQPEIIAETEEDGIELKEDEVFSFTEQPVLGGMVDASNLEPINIYKHFALTGYIHKEVYDLNSENNEH